MIRTLSGSFSAVSKPIFASKYSLESSRRDLHNALLCTVLESIIISKFSLKIAEFFAVFSPKFRKFCENITEFSPNLTNFFRDFSKMQHSSKIFKLCSIFLGIFSKNCRFFRKKAGFSGHETAKKVDSVNHIPSVLYLTDSGKPVC